MRILVIGATGMLGHKLVQVLGRDFEVFGTIRGLYRAIEPLGLLARERVIENVDADELASVRLAVEAASPDVVINAVGIVKQLPDSKTVVRTLRINSIFPHLLAEICSDNGARLITMSTDCVFAGTKGNYSENDTADALDLYGQSKHWGEVSDPGCLTLRTSIIGREIGSPHSLIEWFLGNAGGITKGFRKAIYTGFPTIIIADIIKDLAVAHPELSGVYHVSSEPISKFDLLELARDAFGIEITIEPDDEFRIDRSLDSTRFRAATGFAPIPWPDMIARMAADDTPYDKWRKERTWKGSASW